MPKDGQTDVILSRVVVLAICKNGYSEESARFAVPCPSNTGGKVDLQKTQLNNGCGTVPISTISTFPA